MTASQSDEVAFNPPLEAQLLAHALVVEGFNVVKADSDRNGQVFLSEWFDYATERVPRIGREKKQTGNSWLKLTRELRVQRPRVSTCGSAAPNVL